MRLEGINLSVKKVKKFIRAYISCSDAQKILYFRVNVTKTNKIYVSTFQFLIIIKYKSKLQITQIPS